MSPGLVQALLNPDSEIPGKNFEHSLFCVWCPHVVVAIDMGAVKTLQLSEEPHGQRGKLVEVVFPHEGRGS